MRNFKHSRNFEFCWNLKRREILKCRRILNIVKFKRREISNAHKISGSCARAFKGGAVLQDIRRMPKLRVNFKKFARRSKI
ncbi:hypothetical protein [uncultured Campylobacter sp.]|uniref:hypothetical protein n=1 Tax=uncultured Campylobacter sp. TaxID=218934 RepID=UPI0026018E11|nr:hypothetical protein [uncultured Campylobacter sp.]